MELGESITKNGWTMTLTDCAADDYTVYVGVTLTGPEGTVLDNEKGYLFEDWFSPRFPDLDAADTGGYMQVEDEDPTEDGRIRLVRRPDTPLDVENLTAISICGVRIDL